MHILWVFYHFRGSIIVFDSSHAGPHVWPGISCIWVFYAIWCLVKCTTHLEAFWCRQRTHACNHSSSWHIAHTCTLTVCYYTVEPGHCLIGRSPLYSGDLSIMVCISRSPPSQCFKIIVVYGGCLAIILLIFRSILLIVKCANWPKF